MIHNISRFIAALAIILLTAQTAWADNHVSCRVVITTPTNGSITVTRNDTHEAVASGTILPQGTTITVTATPDNGFDLKELQFAIWTYKYTEGIGPLIPAGWIWSSDGGAPISNGATYTIEENKEYMFNAKFDQNVVKYSITQNITGSGSLEVTSESVAGNQISVGYTPGDGCELTSFSVTKADNSNVSVNYDKVKDKYYFTMPAANVTVHAVFTANGYTVHFDANANDATGTMANQTIRTGSTEALTTNAFSRTNYVFAGWNTASDGSGTAYADGASVTNLTTMAGATITLYAQWKATYTVHFDANATDATGTMANQTFIVGQSQALTSNGFSRTNYVFAGWNTASDGSGTAYADGASVTNLTTMAGATITLYAQWKATYTVHFDANATDATGTMANQTFIVGQSQALTSNGFSRTNYVFAGWNTASDGSGTAYADGASVTNLTTMAGATITLYAQWKTPVNAEYVDADGTQKIMTGCVEITPNYMPTTLAGNYIVSESVTYTSKVTLSGNTTIVLANGKTMSIGTEAAPLGGDYALYASGTNSLTIYGQSLDAATAGRLEVYSTWGAAVRLYEGSYAQHSGNVVVNRSGGSNNNYAINAGGSVTIDGGKLDASITSEGSFAIDARGNISISGGSVTANATGADSYGVRAKGNITLTWTRATDRITASGYQSTNGTVSLSKRFAFDDGGTVTQATTDNIGGQTLRPAALVTFNANGGSDVAAQTLFIGTTATEPTPTRTGYDLSGWTLGNADYDFATLVTEDITLTAQWTPDPAHFSQSGDEYTIHTATGWGVFCDCLNDNDTYNHFSGKTVQLGADITVTRMAGGDGHEFTGTFDGGGHTLTVNYANTDNNTRTAPFSYVDGATIQNLIVGGTISGDHYRAAGIIGETVNTTSHITNCVSSVDISSGRYTGGFSIGGNVEIEGCVFNGKIKGTTYSGGFIGYSYSAQVIKNSLFAPQDGSSISGGTFYYNGGGDVAPVNSYYTQALGTAQGKACHSVTAGTDVTIEAIALTGTATQYTVSGITAYSGGGLQLGQTLYYGSGDQLSLTLSNSATGAPQGYQYAYTASAGTLSGTTLTMPDEDVTISVALAPIDWATVNQGSPKDPYMIYNKDQLLLLAHRVNGTNDETANMYYGKFFKLGADITFDPNDLTLDEGQSNYEAIGGNMRYFNGVFDGANHTVSGIRIRKDGSDNADSYQGLFGFIDGAQIHDVHLTDARITGRQNVGGIAGYINAGSISGCTITDSYITATGYSNYGTICGFTKSYSSLTNNYYHDCTVNGTAVTSGVGCNGADITANNGALPAYAITLGANITTPPGTFAGQTGWLATPPVGARLAPENGFTLAGNHYFASGYEFTPGSTLASGAAQGYTPRATLGDVLLDLYTPTGDDDLLAGKAIARLTITADCDGKTLASTEAIYSTGKSVTVAYINDEGTPDEASAIALDGTETNLAAGWYYVGNNISYNATLTLGGDVHLILADGKTMNVTTTGDEHKDYCINAPDGHSLHIYGQTEGTGALNAQTQGNANSVIHIEGGTLGIHGGNVTATVGGTPGYLLAICVQRTTAGDALVIDRGNVTANGNNGCGISIQGGDAHINGGQVVATGASAGITVIDLLVDESLSIPGILTLSGGTLIASSFKTYSGASYAGTLAIAPGLTYTDGTSLYDSTTETATLAALGGKTLQPFLALADAADNTAAITDHAGQPLAVALSGRTLYKDGSWNTLCLPFAVDLTASGTLSGDNAQAMTLNTTTSTFADGTLTLNFTAATAIPAGTPFIIKWDKPANYVAYTGQNAATCSDLVSPVFLGVTIDAEKHDATVTDVLTFTGTYAPVRITDATGDNTKLYLGAANKLYYPAKAMTIGTHRAYFQLLGDLTAGEPTSPQQAGVRAFVLNFGDDEATGIISVHDSGFTVNGSAAWYTLDGRRLDGQPTAKGLYIHGGKKVVVK